LFIGRERRPGTGNRHGHGVHEAARYPAEGLCSSSSPSSSFVAAVAVADEI
jgi:hypothetical protein